MFRRNFLLILGMVVVLGFARAEGQEKSTETKKGAASDGKQDPVDVDVTKEARLHNSDAFANPPATFRPGHATPRQLPKGAIIKNKDGFTVQLPSKAPIPTPAVYRGKVYVSGGFRSKEFYCLDARTGQLIWGVDLDDDGPSSAAVEDGVAVYNTESCTIFAHDAETGKLLWSHWLGDPLMSSPTIANGFVFTSYPASGQTAVTEPSAEKVQQKQAVKKNNAGKAAPPLSHVLACFDLKTGKLVWQNWIDSDVMSAPVAQGKELHVATLAGNLYRFGQADGQILSAKKSRATSSPVVQDGDVLYTKRTDKDKQMAQEGIAKKDRITGVNKVTESRKANNLDVTVQQSSKLAADGKQLDAANGFSGGAPAQANAGAAEVNIGKGSVSTIQAYQGSRVLPMGGYVFACPGGDQLVCTNGQTGAAVWKMKLDGDLAKEGGSLAAPPAAAGGQLFLCTLVGEVLQVEPKGGKIAVRHKVGSPLRFQPAIVDGCIYVGTQDGKLVCIDTGTKALTGWSMWGGNAARTGTIDEASPHKSK